MDFFIFVVIAFFLYGLFTKKDKPPQRRQQSPSDRRTPPTRSAQSRPAKKETIFESLEKQIRESAEKFEQELKGDQQRPKRVPLDTPPRRYKPQSPVRTSKAQRPEGTWASADQSTYGRTFNSEGMQGVEGVQGQEGLPGYEGLPGHEGLPGIEGSFGTEGRPYSELVVERVSIQQGEIGASPIYSSENKLAKNLGFSSSAVVQGVIWAEILKEPKGKKWFARR